LGKFQWLFGEVHREALGSCHWWFLYPKISGGAIPLAICLRPPSIGEPLEGALIGAASADVKADF